MYLPLPITSNSLPPKNLCLTYDDGPGLKEGADPGPNTGRLAEYLHGQGIVATFFMAGKHIERYPDLVRQVKALGHLVANHTYAHPNVVDYQAAGGEVANEILQTDRLIQALAPAETIYFRPPYLRWSEAVAQALNGNLMATLGLLGPIGCDYFLPDYARWGDGVTPENCAKEFYKTITRKGDMVVEARGIVLLHDSSADLESFRRANRTFELTQLLVKKLKKDGYRFVGLDAIPAIRRLAETPLVCGLRGSNGRYLSVAPEGSALVNAPRFDAWERLTAVPVVPGKVALRAGNGKYLSPQNGGGSAVLANGPAIGGWEPLDVISLGASRVAFRTVTGHFLTRENAEGGRLMAHVGALGGWEVFTFENHTEIPA